MRVRPENLQEYKAYRAKQTEEKATSTGKEAAQRNLEPQVYTVEDLQTVLQIGRSTAYELVNRKGFPVLRLGKRILVPAAELTEWLKKNTVA